LFYEWETVPITPDADTTNGSWSTQQSTAQGTTTNGIAVASQRKVVTATATQTYNVTLDNVADCILGWIQLTETAGGGASTKYLTLLGVG
jgi:hypothetical protein